MNQRISFFTIETTLTTKEIVSSLISMRYIEGKNSGFMLSKVNGSKIKAKHVYKYENTSDIIDPFGEVKKTSIEAYYVNEFILHNGYVEVINPAKSLSHFRRDLLKALNNDCVISNIEVDLKKFIDSLSSKLDLDFYVSCLDVYSKKIIDSSTLKLSLSSNKDALYKVKQFLPDANYDLRKVNIRFNGDSSEVEINSRGNVKFTRVEMDNKGLDSIIDCLLDCCST